MDPLLGHTIAGHKILERLASDAVCKTYKASHAAMARLVAFKALKPDAATSADTLARFQDTAKAAAQVHHPNIASIYDVGEAQGVHFCTMEYVEGRSVAELLRARQKITSDDAVRVAVDVAEALRFANARAMPGFALDADRVVLSSRGEVKVIPPTLTPANASVLDDGYVLRAVGTLLYAMLSGGRVPDLEAALDPGQPAPRLQPIKKVAMGTRQDIAAATDRLVGAGGEPYPTVEAALGDLRQVLQRQERAESRTRSATDRARERRRRSLIVAIAAVSVGAVFLLIIIGLLLSRKAKRDALQREFVGARKESDASIDAVNQAWSRFCKDPSPQLAQAALTHYSKAKEALVAFQARHPNTVEAQQAAAWIGQIDKAASDLRARADDRLRHLKEYNALKALRQEFDADEARKLEQGGEMDLAYWRGRYLELLKQFPRSGYVQDYVERALRTLPQEIKRTQMRVEANQLKRDFEHRLKPEHAYAQALADLQAFRKKYDPVDYLRKEALEFFNSWKTEIDRDAREQWPRQMNHARSLVAQGKHARAREIYKRIIRNYAAINRRSFAEKAQKELDKLPKP